MPELYVAIVSIALKAFTAILVALVGWNKEWTKWQRGAIWGIAAGLLLSAVSDGVLEYQHERSQRADVAAQMSMRDSLLTLQNQAQQEAIERQTAALKNKKMQESILPLIREGVGIRDRCSAPGGDSQYRAWTKRAERVLAMIDPIAAGEFKSSEGPFICYQQMSVELGTLNSILARH